MTSQNALKLPKNYIQTNGWIKPEYGGVGNSSGMMDLYKKRRGGGNRRVGEVDGE